MYTLTAGAVAGAAEAIITYPTEYVKTQLQLQDGGLGSARNGGVVRNITTTHDKGAVKRRGKGVSHYSFLFYFECLFSFLLSRERERACVWERERAKGEDGCLLIWPEYVQGKFAFNSKLLISLLGTMIIREVGGEGQRKE
jgi:hypothetical protein